MAMLSPLSFRQHCQFLWPRFKSPSNESSTRFFPGGGATGLLSKSHSGKVLNGCLLFFSLNTFNGGEEQTSD